MPPTAVSCFTPLDDRIAKFNLETRDVLGDSTLLRRACSAIGIHHTFLEIDVTPTEYLEIDNIAPNLEQAKSLDTEFPIKKIGYITLDDGSKALPTQIDGI